MLKLQTYSDLPTKFNQSNVRTKTRSRQKRSKIALGENYESSIVFTCQ